MDTHAHTLSLIRLDRIKWFCVYFYEKLHEHKWGFISLHRNEIIWDFSAAKCCCLLCCCCYVSFLSLCLTLFHSFRVRCVCVCVRCRCRCRCRYVFKPAVDIIQVYSDKASREHYGFFTSVHRMWYFSI